MRLAPLLLALALLGCESADTDTTVEPKKEETRKKKKKKKKRKKKKESPDQLRARVEDATKKAIVDRDYEPFIAMLSPKAKIFSQRTEQSGGFDTTFDYVTVVKSARVRVKGERDYTMDVTFSDEVAEADGDDIRIAFTQSTAWQHKQDDRRGVDVARETYRLRMTEDGFRIIENRFWNVSSSSGGSTVTYDDAYWQKRDDMVASATDGLSKAQRLVRARRWNEAYAIAVGLTTDDPTSVGAWYVRARAEDRLRRVDDAAKSYRKLKELQPSTSIPAWVK